MQVFVNNNADLNKKLILAKRERVAKDFFFKNVLMNESGDFVSGQFARNKGPAPRFDMKGFFLHSTLDLKIKSVPVFIFSLQRRESRETYVSCFYVDDFPKLFELFNKNKASAGDHAFFFNWFEHEELAPAYPPFRGEIANAFFHSESRFLEGRSFDATSIVIKRMQRLAQVRAFYSRAIPRPKFIRRSRFYKRKFNWFLKYSGVKRWT